jgi:hypothetical protein
VVDRNCRDRLADTITRYANEEMTAFAFDEAIQTIGCASSDATVNFVVGALWFHYDDCKDHMAGLSKPEWDYFQRLILLLRSDSEIEYQSRRRWSVRQPLAMLALAGFATCIAWLGFGEQVIAVAFAFGPISLLLAYWRRRSEGKPTQEELGLTPFASFAELRSVRKGTTAFSKRRYPADAKIRNVHGRLGMFAAHLNGVVLWWFASPLVLLFQALPEREQKVRVRLTSVGTTCGQG